MTKLIQANNKTVSECFLRFMICDYQSGLTETND